MLLLTSILLGPGKDKVKLPATLEAELLVMQHSAINVSTYAQVLFKSMSAPILKELNVFRGFT